MASPVTIVFTFRANKILLLSRFISLCVVVMQNMQYIPFNDIPLPSLEVGAEEAEQAGEGGPGGVVDVLPPVVPPHGPAVLHVSVLPVDALLPEAHHPQINQNKFSDFRIIT